MKLYDLTKRLLVETPIYRDSDKLLVWRVWEELGFVQYGKLTKASLLNKRCPSSESITRCRRKIQEYNPQLSASKGAQKDRESKYATQGNFVFQEVVNKVKDSFTPVKTPQYKFVGGIAILVDK